MNSVLLNEKICELLGVVLVASGVVGHHVVVEVVVAAKAHEVDAATNGLRDSGRAKLLDDLSLGACEVSNLLVEGYAAHLHAWPIQYSS